MTGKHWGQDVYFLNTGQFAFVLISRTARRKRRSIRSSPCLSFDSTSRLNLSTRNLRSIPPTQVPVSYYEESNLSPISFYKNLELPPCRNLRGVSIYHETSILPPYMTPYTLQNHSRPVNHLLWQSAAFGPVL